MSLVMLSLARYFTLLFLRACIKILAHLCGIAEGKCVLYLLASTFEHVFRSTNLV